MRAPRRRPWRLPPLLLSAALPRCRAPPQVTSFSDTGLFVEDGSRCWITTVCDSASSHTLATSTTTHKPTVEDVWTTLCMAMAYPMVGPARKPRHLLIAHRMAQMAPELRVRLARWGVDSRLESRAEAELICAQYGTDPDGLNNQEKTAEDAPMPPLEVALKERGNECFTAGKYDQAVSYYSQALQLAPEDNVLYSNR